MTNKKKRGLCLVLIGPDGCGKTSVGSQLSDKLGDKYFEGNAQYYHWKPRLLNKMNDRSDPFGTPCTDPHGTPPRSKLFSFLYFIAHTLEIIPAWLLRISPALKHGELVIIDRYYYDFMVDPIRYRMDVREPLAWLGYSIIPKPDLVLCMDAPAEVLQSRKQEVSFKESDRQQKAYAALVQKLPYGHIVDASQPLEQVVDDALNVVLNYISQRNY